MRSKSLHHIYIVQIVHQDNNICLLYFVVRFFDTIWLRRRIDKDGLYPLLTLALLSVKDDTFKGALHVLREGLRDDDVDD